jgi:hypothetical protein
MRAPALQEWIIANEECATPVAAQLGCLFVPTPFWPGAMIVNGCRHRHRSSLVLLATPGPAMTRNPRARLCRAPRPD